MTFRQGNTKSAKLSNVEILELRDRVLNQGWTQGQAARHYRIHINSVGRIVRGESRMAVPMPAGDELPARLQEAMEVQRQTELLAQLQADIKVEQAKPNPEKDLEDLADWDRAGKFGANKE